MYRLKHIHWCDWLTWTVWNTSWWVVKIGRRYVCDKLRAAWRSRLSKRSQRKDLYGEGVPSWDAMAIPAIGNVPDIWVATHVTIVSIRSGVVMTKGRSIALSSASMLPHCAVATRIEDAEVSRWTWSRVEKSKFPFTWAKIWSRRISASFGANGMVPAQGGTAVL